MERFIVFGFTLLLALPAQAQEACYTSTKCVDDDVQVLAEIVPASELFRCEDYKAQSKAVPGLILAERNAAIAGAKCTASDSVLKELFANVKHELTQEREQRISAEKRVIVVAVVVAIITAGVTAGAAFLVGSLAK